MEVRTENIKTNGVARRNMYGNEWQWQVTENELLISHSAAKMEIFLLFIFASRSRVYNSIFTHANKNLFS